MSDNMFPGPSPLEKQLFSELKIARARIAELEHAFDKQKEYIARLEDAQRWIPVGERLPEAGERYPGYSTDVLSMSGTRPEGIYLSCYKYEDGEWFDIVTDDVIEGVTYWMPLPEPPEVTP